MNLKVSSSPAPALPALAGSEAPHPAVNVDAPAPLDARGLDTRHVPQGQAATAPDPAGDMPPAQAAAAQAKTLSRLSDEMASDSFNPTAVLKIMLQASQALKTAFNETKWAEKELEYQHQLNEVEKMKTAATKELVAGIVTNAVSAAMGGVQLGMGLKQLKGIVQTERTHLRDANDLAKANKIAQQADQDLPALMQNAEEMAKTAQDKAAKAADLAKRYMANDKTVSLEEVKAAKLEAKSALDVADVAKAKVTATENTLQEARDAATKIGQAPFDASEATQAAADTRLNAKRSHQDMLINMKNTLVQASTGGVNALAGLAAAGFKYSADMDQAEARAEAAEASRHSAFQQQAEATEQNARDLVKATISATQELVQTLNSTEQQIARNFA